MPREKGYHVMQPWRTESPRRSYNLGPNFQFLKTCRQIAVEAALLPYELNTFFIPLFHQKDWAARRSPAQLAAITTVVIGHEQAAEYVLGPRPEVPKGYLLTPFFPRVKQVIVEDSVCEEVFAIYSDESFDYDVQRRYTLFQNLVQWAEDRHDIIVTYSFED
jgi:hypothetical protein